MIEEHAILNKLPRKLRDSLTARSIQIWTFIYNYIEHHHYADCADECFINELCSRFGLSYPTASTHLRRMRRVGLLQAWEGTAGKGQTSPYTALLFGIPPSRFIRYTLPGRKPPRELYRRVSKNSDADVV